METNSSILTQSCCCSFEWLTTCSNQVEFVQLPRCDEKNSAFSAQAFESDKPQTE